VTTRYGCLVADPPWEEHGGCNRGADSHYPTMSTKEIRRLMLRELSGRVANSAHLWLWVTDNFLEDGLGIIDALEFSYKRTFVWVKMAEHPVETTAHETARGALQIGLGQYARGAHELCLFATSGRALVPPPESRPPSVLFAPRQEHSRKPDECYARWFERVSVGPRLEMFARRARPGWAVFGNDPSLVAAAPATRATDHHDPGGPPEPPSVDRAT
jgi:N6-adenosine-specific RNA methylase IME4